MLTNWTKMSEWEKGRNQEGKAEKQDKRQYNQGDEETKWNNFHTMCGHVYDEHRCTTWKEAAADEQQKHKSCIDFSYSPLHRQDTLFMRWNKFSRGVDLLRHSIVKAEMRVYCVKWIFIWMSVRKENVFVHLPATTISPGLLLILMKCLFYACRAGFFIPWYSFDAASKTSLKSNPM